MRTPVVVGLCAAFAAGCAADADERDETSSQSEQALVVRCNEAAGLCVGTSNLYFGGQFPVGYRYARKASGELDKSKVCNAAGRCLKSEAAMTHGTLRSFAAYADAAGLSVVSLQETSGADLEQALSPAWAVACDKRFVYRKDRIELRGPEMRPGTQSAAQLSPICAQAIVRRGDSARELLFVGGGMLGSADGDGDPAAALAKWVDGVREGRPVVIGIDMNGSAPGDGAAPMNPKRHAALRRAGFVDGGHRNTVVGPIDRTLDYLWVKGTKHEVRGYQSGGSDHVWIWSRIDF